MILPCERIFLSCLSKSELKRAILERRYIIRGHRDARGDDRCWLDDYLVWAMLPAQPFRLFEKLDRSERMEKCTMFYRLRRSETTDPIPSDAIIDPDHWDEDLRGMTYEQALDELVKIQEAIRRHGEVRDCLRTIDDDRALYAILPEKVPADFRLPPEDEFLLGKKSGAGCPNFWDSHSACGRSCNLHQWGPCVKR